jgi:hypothetical protein
LFCAERNDLVCAEFAQLLARYFADLRGGQCRYVFGFKDGQLVGGQCIQCDRGQGFGLSCGQGHHGIS